MTEQTQHSILIIDDHPLFRKGVAELISMNTTLSLVGEAASGEEGLALAITLNPELILLDLNMKGMDGIATLKAIKEADLDSRVIMLTVSDSEEHVVSAIRAGADGYLLKDMEPEDILKNLVSAAEGQLVVDDKLSRLLAYALRKETRPKDTKEAGLTEREKEIVELTALGLSNKLIARKLNITEGTVKVHIKHLLKKLQLRSRVEIAIWAIHSKKH